MFLKKIISYTLLENEIHDQLSALHVKLLNTIPFSSLHYYYHLNGTQLPLQLGTSCIGIADYTAKKIADSFPCIEPVFLKDQGGRHHALVIKYNDKEWFLDSLLGHTDIIDTFNLRSWTNVPCLPRSTEPLNKEIKMLINRSENQILLCHYGVHRGRSLFNRTYYFDRSKHLQLDQDDMYNIFYNFKDKKIVLRLLDPESRTTIQLCHPLNDNNPFRYVRSNLLYFEINLGLNDPVFFKEKEFERYCARLSFLLGFTNYKELFDYFLDGVNLYHRFAPKNWLGLSRSN